MSHVVGCVVVGVSGSPGSLQALRFAVGHARALGATLVPVIAWEPPGGDSANRRFPPYLADEWADAALQRLVTAFEEGLGALPPGLPTQSLVIRGRPGSSWSRSRTGMTTCWCSVPGGAVRCIALGTARYRATPSGMLRAP